LSQFLVGHVLTSISASGWWDEIRTQFLEAGGDSSAINLDHEAYEWLLSSSSPLASSWRSSPSLSLLMQEVLRHNSEPQQQSRPQPQICRKFPDLFGRSLRNKQRRIFVGGLIADDSWHVIGADALEGRGMYHAITLVESNRTQSFHPRKLRFSEGSDERKLLLNHMYGNTTLVRLVAFVNEDSKINSLRREHMMRDRILREWKALGMQADDVGLIHDPDEIVSREFLEALAWCETTGHVVEGSPAWTIGISKRKPAAARSFDCSLPCGRDLPTVSYKAPKLSTESNAGSVPPWSSVPALRVLGVKLHRFRGRMDLGDTEIEKRDTETLSITARYPMVSTAPKSIHYTTPPIFGT